MTLSTHKNVLVSFYAASAWPVNKYTIQHYYMRKTSVTGSFTDRVTIWPFIKLIRLKVTAARTPTYYVKVHSQILLVRHYFGDRSTVTTALGLLLRHCPVFCKRAHMFPATTLSPRKYLDLVRFLRTPVGPQSRRKERAAVPLQPVPWSTTSDIWFSFLHFNLLQTQANWKSINRCSG